MKKCIKLIICVLMMFIVIITGNVNAEDVCIYSANFTYTDNFGDVVSYNIDLTYEKSNGVVVLKRQTENFSNRFVFNGTNIISSVQNRLPNNVALDNGNCPKIGIVSIDPTKSAGNDLTFGSGNVNYQQPFASQGTTVSGDNGIYSLPCELTTLTCRSNPNASNCVRNNALVTKSRESGQITVKVPTVNGTTLICSVGGTCSDIASKFRDASGNIQCPNPTLYMASSPVEGDPHSYLLTAEQADAAIQNGNLTEDDFMPDIQFGDSVNCDALRSTGIVDDINEILHIVYILVPVLVMILGSVDFGKAVMSQDNDFMKKATSSFIKRMIAAVVLFFLPLLIKLIFGAAGFDDILCGIGVIFR